MNSYYLVAKGLIPKYYFHIKHKLSQSEKPRDLTIQTRANSSANSLNQNLMRNVVSF